MHACVPQGASFGFFHDMLVTPNYYVLVENPIALDLQKLLTRYMFGRACLAECLEFRRDRRTRVHLLRRPGRQGGVLGGFRVQARLDRQLGFWRYGLRQPVQQGACNFAHCLGDACTGSVLKAG